MYGKRSCATLTFAPTAVTRRENSSRNRSNAARLSLLVIAMTFGDEVEEIYLDSQNPVWYNGVSPSGNWGDRYSWHKQELWKAGSLFSVSLGRQTGLVGDLGQRGCRDRRSQMTRLFTLGFALLALYGFSGAYNPYVDGARAAIKIVVCDELGQPVPNARLTVGFQQSPERGKTVMGMTDAKGAFCCEEKTISIVNVWAEKDGYYKTHMRKSVAVRAKRK